MVYCVGLTGNVASGKSTVAAMFGAMGAKQINADQISRDLTAKDEPAYQDILEHFGSNILLKDGQLNRRALREIIFSDAKQRQWLENALHPLIRQKIEWLIKDCKSIYCMIEIPLLIDTSLYPYLNRVLLITAPVELQISRIMARDQCSKEQALAILSAQPDFNLRLHIADDRIHNEMDLNELRIKIQNLHEKYLHESKKYDKMVFYKQS